MDSLNDFEWDADKAKCNLKSHKVSFEEGATIHSVEEDRFISICMSVKDHLLLVVHTERGEKTRIISCRKATLNERKLYEEGY